MPPRGKPGSRRKTKPIVKGKTKPTVSGKSKPVVKGKTKPVVSGKTTPKSAPKPTPKATPKATPKPTPKSKPSVLKRFASRVLGRAAPGVGLALTGAEIANEASKIPARRRADKARQTAVAKKAEQQAVKPRAGQSPTDAMRQASKGREVLEPAKRAASKYKVKSGDTLSQIAKKNGTTVRAIMKASGIKNANQIKVGQQITIPDDVKRKGPYGKITKKELESGKYNTSKTPKFGADFSYGGSMKKKTTMKNKGGKIGRGCGAATRGGGAVMK